DVWGFVNPNMWAYWIAMIAGDGVIPFRADIPAFDLDRIETQAAMERVYNLVHLYKGAPGPDERPNVNEAWFDGTASIMMNSANAIWSDVDFDFTVLPNPRGSVGRVMPGGPQPMA